ncbi:anaerobic benzoate catabolism transcriptional regulator [Halomonas sp. THAF5a]|uniref:helix-turn-helix domain-containing protein n=1 Tax=Halomonas sp. THAF5a TaxID=2587844 RepID=UPI0012696658|nr:helix-turn-helix transcriptional regulator [Halomonas sp. THAF5a]QFU02076.1 anaerobic benzoate catabolism transcriptional regulator [Halomonas sp. THAF5a]
MDQLAVALGKQIRQARKAQSLSQDRLALLCGIDRSYMGRIERGEVNLTVQKLYLLAKTLNHDPRELLPDPSSLN